MIHSPPLVVNHDSLDRRHVDYGLLGEREGLLLAIAKGKGRSLSSRLCYFDAGSLGKIFVPRLPSVCKELLNWGRGEGGGG